MLNGSLITTKNYRTKTRKVRSDKKKRVKITLSEQEHEKLKWMAFQERMPITNYSTFLIQKGLSKSFIKDLPPEEDYEGTLHYVSVKLSQEEHLQLWEMSVKHNCSIRKIGYTIVKFFIEI